MSHCDTCIFCTFNIIINRWKCSKGHDPVCQSRKAIFCSDYENRGARAAKEALDEFGKKAIEAVKKSNKEDTMSESGLKELINYLQKVDERCSNNTVDYVSIGLKTFDNEKISIDLDIRTSNVNVYSTKITKKLKDL